MANGDLLSVIIPSRREGPRLLEAVRAARMALGEAEVVVVACEEQAEVRDAARAEGVVWAEAPRANRGLQLQLGAARARGRLLVFVHADTRLPLDAGRCIRRALEPAGVAAGAFRLRFDQSHPVLGLLAWLSRMTLPTAFLGDQCLFCTRVAYDAAGGFEPEPLFEDVSLARRLARVGRLVRLRESVTTSARRFVHNGAYRQLAKNACLMLAFHAGVRPEQLSRMYESGRSAPVAATRAHHRLGRRRGVARCTSAGRGPGKAS